MAVPPTNPGSITARQRIVLEAAQRERPSGIGGRVDQGALEHLHIDAQDVHFADTGTRTLWRDVRLRWVVDLNVRHRTFDLDVAWCELGADRAGGERERDRRGAEKQIAVHDRMPPQGASILAPGAMPGGAFVNVVGCPRRRAGPG